MVSRELAESYNDYWITQKIVDGTPVYDLGSVGNNSNFYNIEQTNIQYYNYQNVYKVNTYQIQNIDILIIHK